MLRGLARHRSHIRDLRESNSGARCSRNGCREQLMAELKPGDKFQLNAPGYNGQWFVVEEVWEKGLIAFYETDMKSGTNPDGWRRFHVRHFQIEAYRENHEIFSEIFLEEDLQKFKADLDNALQFVPIGEPIPYDLVTAGIILE